MTGNRFGLSMHMACLTRFLDDISDFEVDRSIFDKKLRSGISSCVFERPAKNVFNIWPIIDVAHEGLTGFFSDGQSEHQSLALAGDFFPRL